VQAQTETCVSMSKGQLRMEVPGEHANGRIPNRKIKRRRSPDRRKGGEGGRSLVHRFLETSYL